MTEITDFNAIQIGLASSERIRQWSHGEVTKPETINYRTLRPERDGLFCERIFGPTKDWECYCGKYKRVRYRGVICERCGVEVTRQKVRRERMGHVELAAPVSHIWFVKGVPSRIGYLLDMAPKDLDKVLYYAASAVTAVDTAKRAQDHDALAAQVQAEAGQIEVERDEALQAIAARRARRQAFLATGQARGFDDEDDFWARDLASWAESAGLPTLDELRQQAAGAWRALVPQIGTQEAKAVRELVAAALTRPERRLSSRELELVVQVAAAVGTALEPLAAAVAKASGAKKGALTRRRNQLLDAVVQGSELDDEAAALLSEVNGRQLAQARQLGDGLLAELLATAVAADGLPEAALALTLLSSPEQLAALQAWALKARETMRELAVRVDDAGQSAVEATGRLEQTWQLFQELEPKLIVDDELLFRELKDRFGSPYGFGVYFEGGMGAEAIRRLLHDVDLGVEAQSLRDQVATAKGQRHERALKRLQVVNAFLSSGNKPEWMILEALPVLPPELRPMIQLDGGRFATADLNDLYRRVINRNNRLKRLLDLGAPEIIVNNEKRMLQEAVDALFDNGRRGRAVTGPGGRPLKSLADLLKGKQGRFRQNLLGKRVDYSGRSVIVAGPHLRLHQCGLPRLMALELFKPFVMAYLTADQDSPNVKAAKRAVEERQPQVWDALEQVIKGHPVLLNRAPTLHRLGIQAFEPVLVDGKAIQVHPLVCHAFNADFDGDQMAVHVPLSVEAQAEARELMLSSKNILSPASGRPVMTPTQDMVLGVYYLTREPARTGERPAFGDVSEIELLLEEGQLELTAPVTLRRRGQRHETSAGRALFNVAVAEELEQALGHDPGYEFVARELSKRELDAFISELIDQYGAEAVAPVLDRIKSLGFAAATAAGVTVAKDDVVVPPDKEEILAQYEARVEALERQYEQGLLTESERHEGAVNIWTEATEAVAQAMQANFDDENPLSLMVASGARGSFSQIRQLAGMRGLMANPKGQIIEQPIKSNFMEGLSVLEYFISTHGARKGLADTALRTADSGYLTRRLVDVSQNVIVREDDCGTADYVELPLLVAGRPNPSLYGRVLATALHRPLADGRPGKVVLAAAGERLGLVRLGELIDQLAGGPAEQITVAVRSVLKCQARSGVCRSCYGTFLATGELVEIGDAVGIIAAQSIGEPGTQLTMRTFHTGGVAGADITQGLPRVVELFEARRPKAAVALAPFAGVVSVDTSTPGTTVTVTPEGTEGTEGTEAVPYSTTLSRRARLAVAAGERVEVAQPLEEGPLDPGELMRLAGPDAAARYLVAEVQRVYQSQGVDIHDKHIEVIVRQMLRRQRVEGAGETDLLPGQTVDQTQLRLANGAVAEPAQTTPLLLGITKAALATDSFLAAASFQETTKVLTDAAIAGKSDPLEGLKENVIIGKLIPAATGLPGYARLDVTTLPRKSQDAGADWEGELEPGVLDEGGLAGGFELGLPGTLGSIDDLGQDLSGDTSRDVG